ncbi:MAG: hypothetical protein LYZ66_07285 [Nitrososphaerales archaeon]|nr:hypothetical protein [Nitrososphaerales archaeon]
MSDDPLESLAKGATKGFFEHWEEKLPAWLSRVKNYELRFIEDESTYEVAKRESGNAEYKLYAQFVPKGWPRVFFKVGLAMREIETEKEKVQSLKDDVYRKHGKAGVHVAELVQLGIITELVGQFAKILGNPVDVTKKLVAFLEGSEDLAIFVRSSDAKHVRRLCGLVKTRVDAMSTHMVIVFGSGFARDIVLKILKCIRDDPRGYAIEIKEDWPQLALFVYSPEMKGKLSHWTEPFAR